jgi:hypothetical protein
MVGFFIGSRKEYFYALISLRLKKLVADFCVVGRLNLIR